MPQPDTSWVGKNKRHWAALLPQPRPSPWAAPGETGDSVLNVTAGCDCLDPAAFLSDTSENWNET